MFLDQNVKFTFRNRTRSAFVAARFENTRTYVITGAHGRTYTVFCDGGLTNTPSQSEDKNQFVIGRNVPLAITHTRTISFPRVVRGTARDVAIPAGEEPDVVQGTLTATFSMSDTRRANGAGETADAAFARPRLRGSDRTGAGTNRRLQFLREPGRGTGWRLMKTNRMME